METSASFEARSAPSSYPTVGVGKPEQRISRNLVNAHFDQRVASLLYLVIGLTRQAEDEICIDAFESVAHSSTDCCHDVLDRIWPVEGLQVVVMKSLHTDA